MAKCGVTPNKSPSKMSFQDLLTQHGERGYEYEMSKDFLHTRVSTQFPTLLSFNLNKKKQIRPFIIKGFPLVVQDLIRGSKRAAINAGREAERTSAIGKLNRIIRDIKKHTYEGYTPESDEEDEDDEEGEGDAKVLTDLNDIPVASAMASVARKIKVVYSDEEEEAEEDEEAKEDDTQECDVLSQQLSQIHLGKVQLHNLQRKYTSDKFLILINR